MPTHYLLSACLQVEQRHLGIPALQLPVDAIGSRLDDPSADDNLMLVEWVLPEERQFDIAISLSDAIQALLRAGPSASTSTQRNASAALALLVHAPEAHTTEALLGFMPPLADLVALLPMCAQLRADGQEPPVLLLALQLLAAMASLVPQPLALLLQRSPLLWSEMTWLPQCDHARHASVLLQTLHCLASASMVRSNTDGPRAPSLTLAHDFVVSYLLPAQGGKPDSVTASQPRMPPTYSLAYILLPVAS